MKKLALVLVAVLTVMFTGCKTETSKVAIHVEDYSGVPVDKCPILYADDASIVLDFTFPSPESLVTDIPDGWEYAETNPDGNVVLPITLSVPKLNYIFKAYDRGANNWVDTAVVIHRGVNEEITFRVNK